MAFLESAVVVYLRELYYPGGFDFPMKLISNTIALTEILREFATIIMLITIAILVGRTTLEKFAFFIYSFAVWDIFYYIFLKFLIDWPLSLFTWDILFLIPFTWVGPVIAPVINSFTMITLAFFIIYFVEKYGKAKINAIQWLLLIIGSLITISAYTEDYLHFMMQFFSFADLFKTSESKNVLIKACQYVPQYFNWVLFSIGGICHFSAIILFYLNNKKANYLEL